MKILEARVEEYVETLHNKIATTGVTTVFQSSVLERRLEPYQHLDLRFCVWNWLLREKLTALRVMNKDHKLITFRFIDVSEQYHRCSDFAALYRETSGERVHRTLDGYQQLLIVYQREMDRYFRSVVG